MKRISQALTILFICHGSALAQDYSILPIESELVNLHASILYNADIDNFLNGKVLQSSSVVKTNTAEMMQNAMFFDQYKLMEKEAPLPANIQSKQDWLMAEILTLGTGEFLKIGSSAYKTYKIAESGILIHKVINAYHAMGDAIASKKPAKIILEGFSTAIDFVPIIGEGKSAVELRELKIKREDYLKILSEQYKSEFRDQNQVLQNKINLVRDRQKRQEYQAIFSQIEHAFAAKSVFRDVRHEVGFKTHANAAPYGSREYAQLPDPADKLAIWVDSSPSSHQVAPHEKKLYFDHLKESALHGEIDDLNEKHKQAMNSRKDLIMYIAGGELGSEMYGYRMTSLTSSSVAPVVDSYLTGKISETQFRNWLAKNYRPIGQNVFGIGKDDYINWLVASSNNYKKEYNASLPASFKLQSQKVEKIYKSTLTQKKTRPSLQGQKRLADQGALRDIRTNPNYQDILEKKGLTEAEIERTAAEIDYFAKRLEKTPDLKAQKVDDKYFDWLANLLETVSMFDLSNKTYSHLLLQHAILNHNQNPEITMGISSIFQGQDDLNQAIKWSEQALTFCTNCDSKLKANIMYKLASYYFDTNNPKKGKDLYKQALQLTSDTEIPDKILDSIISDIAALAKKGKGKLSHIKIIEIKTWTTLKEDGFYYNWRIRYLVQTEG